MSALRRRIVIAVPLLLVFITVPLVGVLSHFGAMRFKRPPLPPRMMNIPVERTLSWQSESPLRDSLLVRRSAQQLPNWQEAGKGNAPRLIMAKLALREDVEACNAYLNHVTPWADTGSSWPLHPHGDYDFTLLLLTAILYLHGNDPAILYPETVEHLLSVLLVEEGGKPTVTVPRSLGLFRDTENHLLMTEGSRYLKNRWLVLHGNKDRRYDNATNGLEAWLLKFLDELEKGGFYEFNSNPYMAYTVSALLNLEAFADEPVRQAARRLLDGVNWEYALSSLSLRKYAPFRRHIRKAELTGLSSDYHSAMITAWMSFHPESPLSFDLHAGEDHALYASLLPYRLPDETARWIEAKPDPYFVRIGHGSGGCPEIYSGGPGYLFSAGGLNRGGLSMLAARPTSLMLDDGAMELDEVIHLAGPGETLETWNNTGVHKRFACAAGPVHIPKTWSPAASNEIWTIYQPQKAFQIAVHSRPNTGVVALFLIGDPQTVLDGITQANGNVESLTHRFQWPEGVELTYDLAASKETWVISAVDETSTDAQFDGWPLMDGEVP